MTTTEYLQSLADAFPARDSHGHVVGHYVYSGYTAGGQRMAGPFPTALEASECAAEVVDGHVVVGYVFTASGKIVKDSKAAA